MRICERPVVIYVLALTNQVTSCLAVLVHINRILDVCCLSTGWQSCCLLVSLVGRPPYEMTTTTVTAAAAAAAAASTAIMQR